MNNSELEKILVESLADFKLDQEEKYQLKQLSGELAREQINFIRNKSFDLCHSYVETGGEKAFRALNWLERVVKTIQPSAIPAVEESSAYFSPGQQCRNKIIRLIKNSRKQLDICVFTISDNQITDAILDAHKRKVRVNIISDNDKANDRGSDIDFLSNKGVNVLLDDSPCHMHHKFALFDRRILLNGSFNWTRSASEANEENILVTADKGLVTTFNAQFALLTQKFS